LAVVTGGEPEAQAILRDQVVLEVLREPELMPEVLAGDLLGRLADLEGRLGGRALALLSDEDAGLWPRLHNLVRDGQPGEATPEDRDVVPFGCLMVIAHLVLPSASS